LKCTDSINQPSPALDDTALQFLQMQVTYVTSHLQIADAKAAALIAYISVLFGCTASKVSIAPGAPYGLAAWPALIGVFIGSVSLVSAFLAVYPRSWPGRDAQDPFSWVGLSGAASTAPYVDRIPKLTATEMKEAVADAVETCSLIIRRKYSLVSAAVVTSLVATPLMVASWLLA